MLLKTGIRIFSCNVVKIMFQCVSSVARVEVFTICESLNQFSLSTDRSMCGLLFDSLYVVFVIY